MGHTVIIALLLCAILAFFSPHLQAWCTRWVHVGRARVFAGPILLSAVFTLVMWSAGLHTAAPLTMILAYTLAPTVLAFMTKRADFAAILLLWLPLEFAAGAGVIPKPMQGFAHTVAYGIAILLALWIFLIYRQLPGMKYNMPLRARDWIAPLVGYAAVAPILIVVGLWLSFIKPFHIPPGLTAGFVLTRFLLILAATALPEEILFRALIQNKIGSLLLASVIFGCAHLNNGPGLLPNWRYAIMATIAGFAYGKVFQKSSSVFSSAFLHALINTSKHVFF